MKLLIAFLLSFTLAAVAYGQTFRGVLTETPRIAAQRSSLRPSSTQIKRAVMIQDSRHSNGRHRADARQRLAGPPAYRR